jgi:very-short-patch-repair endonuclease
MAAVLSCGSGAGLSHGSAAAHWAVGQERPGQIEISVPAAAKHRRPGILVHRRGNVIRHHMTEHQGIPITSPALTLVDLATRLAAAQLERAINEADKRSLIDPEALRAALGSMPMMPGIAALRRVLDHRVFRLTDSELERRFLRLVRRAGLPLPKTGWTVNGFRVDFYWPDLGLVVEADGLRYHRTPAQQTRDRLRDQAHTAAGMIPLRFTHAQIAFEPDHVQATLCAVADGVRRRGLSPNPPIHPRR